MDENFEKEIQKNEKPIMVDFWASWCGPCKMLGPILEKIAKEYKDKIVFLKAETEKFPISCQKYSVDRIPTVILFKGGKPISQFVGALPEQEIKKWLNENL
ncbi:thioredoxin [Patescibacteria group bacterium]